MRKNTIFTRLIALLLCVMSIMSIVPAASAAETTTVNLNDGVYSYGRFDKDGNPYDKDTPRDSSFRSANFLPVEGGRTITCYYEKAEWNGDNIGLNVYVVEYDLGKNIIGARKSVMAYYPSGKVGLLLHEDTAYIQIAFEHHATSIITPLDSIEIGVYYIDEYVNGYIAPVVKMVNPMDTYYRDPLYGKHIIYDGDEITEPRLEAAFNGGSYPYMIANATSGTYQSHAQTGAWVTSNSAVHSLVDNLQNLRKNGDLERISKQAPYKTCNIQRYSLLYLWLLG